MSSKTSLDRELFVDSLKLKLDIEEIKRRLENQDKNLELVFSYLDELIEWLKIHFWHYAMIITELTLCII